jgi:hypothetical protein
MTAYDAQKWNKKSLSNLEFENNQNKWWMIRWKIAIDICHLSFFGDDEIRFDIFVMEKHANMVSIFARIIGRQLRIETAFSVYTLQLILFLREKRFLLITWWGSIQQIYDEKKLSLPTLLKIHFNKIQDKIAHKRSNIKNLFKLKKICSSPTLFKCVIAKIHA